MTDQPPNTRTLPHAQDSDVEPAPTSADSHVPRVVLLTYPGLYGAAVINEMATASGFDLVGIGLSHRIFKGKGYLATAKTMVERTGVRFTTYSFFITDFSWSILRLKGRPTALGRSGAAVRYLTDINAESTVEWLASLSPDYVASCYFNQLIGPEVIALPREACVNLHPAPLPALRGSDPCFRIMFDSRVDSELSLHLVDTTFDTGDILCRESLSVPATQSLLAMNLHIWQAGSRLLAEWLSGEKGATDPVPQSTKNEGYFTWPNADEIRAFRSKGYHLMTMKELRNGIRSVWQ